MVLQTFGVLMPDLVLAPSASLPAFVTRQTCRQFLGLEWRSALRAARQLNVAVVILGRQACFSPSEFLAAARERGARKRHVGSVTSKPPAELREGPEAAGGRERGVSR